MEINPFITAPPECQIVSQRIFIHSRARLFEAWTNPDQLKNWWGPAGFTNTFHEFHLNPGGIWRFTMHGPNGVDYPNLSRFAAIVENELLVWDHINAPEFRGVTTFEDYKANQTLLIYRMIFQDPELCNSLRNFILEKNEENFERLEAELQRDDFFYT